MTRQISSVEKLTVPTIGNCASAHISASASSTQRVATRLTMKPTTMAEIENRKKNEEPSRPNCSGWSFSSVMIGTPASPTTILSAKLTSMNRNSRNVIFQAPLGVGCVVIVSSPVRSLALLVDLGRCYPGAVGQGNRTIRTGPGCAATTQPRSVAAGRCFASVLQPDHDRVAMLFQTVISQSGLAMLRGNLPGDFHDQIESL